ncbi:glycosyl transferase family 1 [Paraburkholderia solisilvae]|uniref:UDP-glucose:protein N-beta-glucosyltransferase n=1 Tax=Paraburkholderia solisilvae TaxID=624376 RepID=A0A6J5EPN2_9BURK|nr:glycosyl transferase family 1 [Paraburkholderia solisilvae]CAB3767176.1 UDP-glucose:protein N-beta-glucosyltransferase [Paraburkholderia solisilvae]
MATSFLLDDFEHHVYRREHDEAAGQLTLLLSLLQQKRGELDGDFRASGIANLPPDLQRERFYARAVAAITTLFADPAFRPQGTVFTMLMSAHAWLGALFAATPLGHADHVGRCLYAQWTGDSPSSATDGALEKLYLLYSGESDLTLELDTLWTRQPAVAANLALALLSAEFQGTASAHGKREALLEWLPGKLAQIGSLDVLPTGVLHNAYMFCSYADTPRRHAIKADINQLVRRKLDELGLDDLDAAAAPAAGRKRRKKPLMMVVLEWFGSAHSIYRTHSRTLAAAREHFDVVAFGFGYAVDDAGRALFDRFIELKEPDYIGECLKTIRDFAEAEQPDVLYMPSVGMFVLTIFMSNLRIAPLQIAGLGHPATTRSERIDYVSVEEDYVGDPACFSEKLLMLPRDGQPYVASSALPPLTPAVPARRDTLEIVVTASQMKLNPRFFDACRRIREAARAPVQFHLMTGARHGLLLEQMRRAAALVLPGAVVHGFYPYADYLARVQHADLFLSPFPFGNTNGIVDAFTLGVPGICKTGPEVFEHIDGALFERAGMPAWTIASSVDDYTNAALRMIDQHDEREMLRARLIETAAVGRFFEGRPQVFGERVRQLVEQTRSAAGSVPDDAMAH